jgi:hypothetical protein
VSDSNDVAKGRRRQVRWWVVWIAVYVSIYLTYVLSEWMRETLDPERIRWWFRALFPFAALADGTRRFIESPPSSTTVALYLQLPIYLVFARLAAARWKREPAIAAVLVLHGSAAFLCGPVSGPSLADCMEIVRSTAGPKAQVCGVAGSHPPELEEAGPRRSRQAAAACARQALAWGRSFWVTVVTLDVDAYVLYALAAGPDETPTLIAWDSDGSGGGSLVPMRYLVQVPCPEPSIGDLDGAPITCGVREGA